MYTADGVKVAVAMSYGSECWGVKKHHQIQTTEVRMLRCAWGKTKDHVKNVDIDRANANIQFMTTFFKMVWSRVVRK